MWKKSMLLLFLIVAVGCTNGAADETLDVDDTAVAETDAVGQETVEEPESEPASEPEEQPTLTPPPLPEVEEEEPEPVEVPTEPPAEEAAPVEEPTEEPAVEVVAEPEVVQPTVESRSFTASDGLEIQTTYATPGGEAPFPGIILLHMLGSNRQIWESTGMIDALRLQGYAVLAIDMRGHGETGGDRDWALAREDFSMIYDQFVMFPEVDAAKTAVIGGSIGSNMSLALGVDRPQIQTAILLSPGLDYRGVTTDDLIVQYEDRPILIVASEEDGYSADSSRTLFETAVNAELEIFNGAGHGTTMLSNEPFLEELIVNWLTDAFG